MKKSIVIISVLLLLTAISGFFSFPLLNANENTKEQDTFDQDSSFQPKVYGDGEVLVTFEVKIPGWTPEEDRIYLVTDGYMPEINGELSRGIPMQEKEEDLWIVGFLAPAKKELKYKYNRNNLGFMTDEEFKPDSEEARRSVMVSNEPFSITDEVKKWRWLTKEPPKVELSTFRPDKLPDREKPFIIGMFMLDFFDPGFTDFIPSTFDRIKEKGFEYIGIAYAPSFFISSKPLKFSRGSINTYTEEQLAFTFSEARKRGLKILLAAGIETDPENFDEIEKEFTKRQSDEWYRQLAKEWEEVMVETAKLAEKYEIEIFTPSDQWFVWGNKTEDQKKMLNPLINKAYESIRAVYSGKISSDCYNPDEAFDYYKQMDWIGDKWWWEIAEKKETDLTEMKVAAQRIVDEIYKPVYSRYKKPIFLQQLSYASYDGAAGALEISLEGPEVAEWFPYNPHYPADFQEQADAYEAVFQAIYDELIFVGVFSFSYTYWDSYDKSAGIRSKPAEDVWVKWNSIFNEK